jgi:hypothetical protein
MTPDDYNRTPEQRVEDEAINARDEVAEDERLAYKPNPLLIGTLTKADVGRWVWYHPNWGERQAGRIKSWNDKFVFVVYKCAGNWEAFKDYTAAATKPEDLEFRS